MRICDTRGFLHLFQCRSFHPERDIIEEGIIEKDRFLIHIPHQATQIVEGGIADIRSVNSNAPLIHIIKTGQQIYQRTFTGTGLANQCDGLSLRDYQVYTFQHPVMLVFKPNIVISYFLIQFYLLRIGRIIDITFSFQDLIDTIHRGQPFLDGINRLT